MSKRLFVYMLVALVALFLYGAYLQIRANHDQTTRETTSERSIGYPADGIHVRITEYAGNAIELACEHGRISVRMRITHSISEDVAAVATDLIRKEIEHLTTCGPTTLGEYAFEFKGEWPMWKPYRKGPEPGGFAYIGVEFANGVVYGQAITAYGLVAPPPTGEEYPYKNIRFRV